MKRLFGLYTLLMLVGCTEEVIEHTTSQTMGGEEYYATFEGVDSRTYVDEQIRMRWTANDSITLFKKNTYNRTFMFTGKTGANAGGFTQVSTDDDYWFGYDVDYSYAIYPHSDDNTLDETDLFFTLTMPAEQTYAENSFGLKANTMVAVSETSQLIFKNVGSYLRVRLYGENTAISSITLTNTGDEAIAGEAKVTPTLNGTPTCEMTGSGKSIRLTCPTPVTISSDADAPTDFWIVIPPVTLAKGFSVTVENSEGETQVFDVASSVTFERNTYNNLKREITLSNVVDTEEEIPTNQIWYTSSDSTILEPAATDVFGANIVSNSYSNGLGIITFDGDVTQVGSSAFNAKTKLLTITLPKTVTSIESYAFEDCTRLSSISASEVKFIGDYAFYNCAKLNEFPFSNLSTVGNYAFQDCIGLTAIDLSKVTDLYYGVFKGCTNLESVTMPTTFSSIAPYIFSDCSSLKSIVIPEGVTRIGREAFYKCSSLNDITIPSTLSSTDLYAFQYCSTIENVYISDIEKYCTIIWGSDEEAYRTRFSGSHNLYLNGNLVENLELSENTTKIVGRTFYECVSLKSISIPESVASIGERAFNGCANLSEVKLPNGLVTIKTSTFEGCSNLTSINVPESVTSIEGYAFGSCDAMNDVYIDNLTAWCSINFNGYSNSNPLGSGANLYLNNTLLTELTIPNGITEISDYLFCGCESITKVTISDQVTSIGYAAFKNCSALTELAMGNNVKTIDDYAFYQCSAITTNLTFGDGLTSIGGYAFQGCSSLTGSLIFGDSLTTIGDYAFQGCSSLTGSLTLGDAVTSIGNSAFSDCSFLTGGLIIGDNLTTIQNSAFEGCSSITALTIGKNVSLIKNYAFSGCTNLGMIYCKPITPPTLSNPASTFKNIASDYVIYVPTESVEEYTSNSTWSYYYASSMQGYDFTE